MKALKTVLSLLPATVAILAFPGPAPAAYLVPPENSAATQYTESFPTAGGDRETDGSTLRRRTPREVLGARNSRRLEAQGAEGVAAATLAAATAPAAAKTPDAPPRGDGDAVGKQRGRGGESPRRTQGDGGPGRAGTATLPSGSSGPAEVLSQSLGFSGGAGALLPLAIAVTIAWAVAFLLRRRQRPRA